MNPETAVQRRDDMVSAAARCFAERGVSSTSIDDIAAEAGVSRASVYRYAGGRDELIIAVAMRRFDEWVDGVVRHAARFDTAGDMITEAVVWTAKTVRRDPSLAALFASGTAVAASRVFNRRASARPTASPTESWRRQFGGLLATRQDELRPDLDPFIVADRVLGVVLERLARAADNDRDMSERRLRDWVDAWLLPAILERRPPLPDTVRKTITTETGPHQ